MYDSLAVEIDDGLARITLAQPERGNALDGTFSRELRAVTTRLATDPSARAVLIDARGRFFSVGGDIRTLTADRDAFPGLVLDLTADLHVALARLRRLPQPVVVAVQGTVAGGALSMVAFGDVVHAAREARFSGAFSSIGFSADCGSTISLADRMGPARARRFLLTGETLDAEAAAAAGLVDHVHDAADLAAAAEATARRFAEGPTRAYAGVKRTMLAAGTNPLEAQMELEAQTLAEIARGDDAWEGLTAFAERRTPRFTGR